MTRWWALPLCGALAACSSEPKPPPPPSSGEAPKILSAGIGQDSRPTTERSVQLAIEIETTEPCQAGDERYGFVFDADLDRNTGEKDPAFEPLGIDAQLAAFCDADGSLVASFGEVTVVVAAMSTQIEIELPLASMPAVELDWIAYSTRKSRLYRLPAARDDGGSITWQTSERSTP